MLVIIYWKICAAKLISLFVSCNLFLGKLFNSFHFFPITNLPKPLLEKGFRQTEYFFHCFFTFWAYMCKK